MTNGSPLTATSRRVPPAENPHCQLCDAEQCTRWFREPEIVGGGEQYCSRNCAIAAYRARGDEEAVRELGGRRT